MATLLIRNLDDSLKQRLRTRAAEHRRSMEEEARSILRRELEEPEDARSLSDIARSVFGDEGIGTELEIEPRGEGGRNPPDFR